MVLLLMAGMLVVWGCGGDDDGGGNPPATTYGSISGIVDGGSVKSAISGATITVGTLTTTSNEQGYFSLANVPVGNRVVNIAQSGYLSVQRVVTVVAGENLHIPNIYLPFAVDFAIDGDNGGSATVGDGTVTFAADSFVDADGDPYTGEVNLEVSTVVPQDPNFYDAFPGDFEGIREDGTTTQFVSFGFMGVNMYNADKSAEVRLAPGTTAELSLQVDESKRVVDQIPMWWFDEATGVWREDGAADYVDGSFVADVSHFTTWNWDLPVDDVCTIEGTVLNMNEQPVAGARVFSRGVDYAIMDDDFTDAAGHFSVRAMKNASSDVWAMRGSFASAIVNVTVGTECPVVLESPLMLLEPAFAITLTWGASPYDLDSHLLIPMTWNAEYDYYNIAYYSMGDMGDDPYTMLDTDDTSSYGPEIISSAHLYQGTYQYWVHNYSQNNSQNTHDSGAQVRLEVGGTIRTWNAADVEVAGADGTGWWHVFDMTVNGTNVTVTPVQQFQPRYSMDGVYADKSFTTVK
ncbi:MAG: carboxypeptidase regulatory-like domain-containing protein [Sulfurimicrobium sp.]|nr:carboxypeptidase regulatory-like domain-containing protein [Sulfurimicrobium sp.]